MKDLITSMRLLWDRQRYENLTGSRIICKTPGYLVSAKMIGTAVSTSTVALHDGEGANEEKILDLSALVMGSDSFNPCLPVPFKRGLYAALGATTSSLTVVVITRKE